MEEKPIPEFEKYTVTSEGRVYSYKWGRKREKRQVLSHGNVVVLFSKNGYRYQRSVALLVANAFIPRPQVSTSVKHKDGDIFNNNINNLEWIVNEDRVRGYY